MIVGKVTNAGGEVMSIGELYGHFYANVSALSTYIPYLPTNLQSVGFQAVGRKFQLPTQRSLQSAV